MVKYVVTGASGELGSRIFKHLIRLVPRTFINGASIDYLCAEADNML